MDGDWIDATATLAGTRPSAPPGLSSGFSRNRPPRQMGGSSNSCQTREGGPVNHEHNPKRVVPYCHVVVPDREMASLLSHSGTGLRCRTKIITTLRGLPDALPGLADQARNGPGDRTGWDWVGEWAVYCLDWNDLLKSVPNQLSVTLQARTCSG